ncbi:hypothetical protein [Rubellimicrobium sp. CFH 75288]|uniref:hypothetical protein n=1 Tax=Rubellimicrobium sp. CFH 75288 TaxID=2697034 RepID=UPI0014120144|nr:hypothetical protein [Rubellimicrobium sp. CFH 75288]NAZ37238.1 hypothetical protein [Rubellimicrobium sp. CFH 75288]
MTAKIPVPRALALVALGLLAACGGPRGDWRAEVRRPTPNPVVLTPAPPLVIPPRLDLPPPV